MKKKEVIEINDIKKFLKHKLKHKVEEDIRLLIMYVNKHLTEYTLQALLWDHICNYVGVSWGLAIESTIPSLDYRADIVIGKLTTDLLYDQRYGSIAIEVKPNGQRDGLIRDIDKLTEYIKKPKSPINFGVLYYLSPRGMHEEEMKSLARQACEYKLEVIRIDPNAP